MNKFQRAAEHIRQLQLDAVMSELHRTRRGDPMRVSLFKVLQQLRRARFQH